jgi:hypothetical protein
MEFFERAGRGYDRPQILREPAPKSDIQFLVEQANNPGVIEKAGIMKSRVSNALGEDAALDAALKYTNTLENLIGGVRNTLKPKSSTVRKGIMVQERSGINREFSMKTVEPTPEFDVSKIFQEEHFDVEGYARILKAPEPFPDRIGFEPEVSERGASYAPDTARSLVEKYGITDEVEVEPYKPRNIIDADIKAMNTEIASMLEEGESMAKVNRYRAKTVDKLNTKLERFNRDDSAYKDDAYLKVGEQTGRINKPVPEPKTVYDVSDIIDLSGKSAPLDPAAQILFERVKVNGILGLSPRRPALELIERGRPTSRIIEPRNTRLNPLRPVDELASEYMGSTGKTGRSLRFLRDNVPLEIETMGRIPLLFSPVLTSPKTSTSILNLDAQDNRNDLRRDYIPDVLNVQNEIMDTTPYQSIKSDTRQDTITDVIQNTVFKTTPAPKTQITTPVTSPFNPFYEPPPEEIKRRRPVPLGGLEAAENILNTNRKGHKSTTHRNPLASVDEAMDILGFGGKL